MPHQRTLPVLLREQRPAAPLPSDEDRWPDLLRGIVDHLSDGLILADGSARVLYMNRTAQAMVSRGVLSIRAGVLGVGVAAETQTLHALVAERARGGGRNAHLRTSRRVFLTIGAVDGGAGLGGPKHAAVILLREADRVPAPSQQSISAYFGLTPAEARLAREIIKGDGVARCARRLGTRVTTARSHLKHIFEKTDTRRQAHLVRLLLSCSPAFDDPQPPPNALPGPDLGREPSRALR